MKIRFNEKMIAIVFFVIFASCQNNNSNVSKSTDKDSNLILEKNNKSIDSLNVNTFNDKSIDHKNGQGVIVLKEGYNQDKILLYNENGSIWKSFILTDEFEDSSIVPYALKSDDRLLVFQLYGEGDLFYKVKVNEKKNLFKLIKRNDKNFIYEPWQKHILDVFSVDFDYKNNPLKEQPDNNAKDKIYDTEEFYHPVKVKNDWLMLKDDDDNESWIKWRDKEGALIITLYYSA